MYDRCVSRGNKHQQFLHFEKSAARLGNLHRKTTSFDEEELEIYQEF